MDNMKDNLLEAIDMSIRLINGEKVDETQIPKVNSREELLNIYQAFKKAILLVENIFV